MYDSRLFNQTGGLDQGFGAEDSYTVYDKAMGKGNGRINRDHPQHHHHRHDFHHRHYLIVSALTLTGTAGGGTAHMFKPTARTDGDAYGKEDLNEVLAKAR